MAPHPPALFYGSGEKSLIYGAGPSRKPDSALNRLMGIRASVDVGGCPRDADFRTNLLEACRSESDDVGVGWGKDWGKRSKSKANMGSGAETFELVVFSSYEVDERAPYPGETRARIGAAIWKRLDRATVKVLVGGKV